MPPLYPRVACCRRLAAMDRRCSLDPAEHPRLAAPSHHESASPSSGDKRQRRKKHRQPKKPELKVTTRGQGDDVPVWSHARSNLSSSLESQTKGDSGVSSYQKPWNNARSTARHDHTPQYSLDTVKRLEEGDLGDAPLSNRSGNSDGDQEMVSGDDRVEETTGADPTGPTGQEAMVTGPAVNLAMALEALLLADPADTDDEKAHRNPHPLRRVPGGLQGSTDHRLEVPEEIYCR